MKKSVVGVTIFILLIGYMGWELASTDVDPQPSSLRVREAVQPALAASPPSNNSDDHPTVKGDGTCPSAGTCHRIGIT
jgi:hypothetical protein